MPLQATSGAASYDGFGGGAAAVPNYIEDVFSTFLYTGNGSTGQTITNGIDLSTKGGLVWGKSRSNAPTDNSLVDTVRGNESIIYSNLTQAADTPIANTISFLSTGFSVKNNIYNANGQTYVSWTFRKQPKFFDVVTYTGNGTAGRTVAHNLGSTPGFMIVKNTTSTTNWFCWHRTMPNTDVLRLNSTIAQYDDLTAWNSTTPTSTVFTVGTSIATNNTGDTYVAYLFAHDAGGFGLTGTDNVISCGSVTRSGSGVINVNLGYEPQWVLFKSASNANNWRLFDVMRGMPVTGDQRVLNANLSDAEDAFSDALFPTATGFAVNQDSGIFGGAVGSTSIYIAIRRGPMKVPTSGTSVFGLNARTGTGANATVTGGQTDDAVLIKNRGSAVASLFSSRLTGTGYLVTSDTAAEVAAGTTILQANPWDVMDGVKVGTTSTITNASANTYINYLFRRAPGFFDEVCYTGNGTAGTTQKHNLGVVPELMIIKYRNSVQSWFVFHSFGASIYRRQFLNLTDSIGASGDYSYGSGGVYQKPDATNFYLESVNANVSGGTYVAYLFATCPGVSKVFSYTGNGSSQTINCGFTGGARFVLIKRTDSTGDWYVWDSARGIVAGNDPHLSLNTTAAEVTTDDSVDTDNTGFIVNQVAATNVNVSSATYIGLAIA